MGTGGFAAGEQVPPAEGTQSAGEPESAFVTINCPGSEIFGGEFPNNPSFL